MGRTAGPVQSVHATEPVTDLYLPATHCVHAPPLGPVDPALQVQSDALSLASRASEFAAQSVQAAEPATDLYLPNTHCVHTPPSGPVYPALQVQSDAL